MSALTFLVHQGAVSSANHLQHVRDRIVLIGVDLAIVVLCIHDNHQVCSQAQSPGQAAGDDGHLHSTCVK